MLYSIIVGLIAGWLTGQVMRGGGYGILIDIVLGLVGGVIGSILVSFVGAVILVAISRAIRR